MSQVFFTDRDLGRKFPAMLAAAGIAVERHGDRFRDDAPDEQWLEHVGRNGLVAITHDARIRYKPNEREAVRIHQVALLVVVGRASTTEFARNFVATMPKIVRFLANHRAPFIAKVRQPAPFELAKDAAASGSVTR